MAPKVFISHASEDKERFVITFAKRLRENGVDAWLDKWEMLLGDSLVEKIFEEGLKEVDAVIIVLSDYSVNKPWVKEELNASIIKKINKGTRVIPVVIDNCDVPGSLQSTLWERIQDLENYEENLERIISSIYGHRTKPPLGNPPSYVEALSVSIPNLTKTDNLVLKLSCEYIIANNKEFIERDQLFTQEDGLQIPEAELKESLDILDRHSYVKLLGGMTDRFFPYTVTTYGFETYAQAYLPEYKSIIQDVIISIVNKDISSNHALAESLNQPIFLIDHILKRLEEKNLLQLSKWSHGFIRVYNISPELKRMLEG